MSARDRTVDQMVQAARSGKQNIIEGSVAAGTSREMEIKLTNVARASLEELLADYLDILRTRGLALWAKDDPRALAVRQLVRGTNASYSTYSSHVESGDVGLAANTIICLIHQANYLLDQQIRQQERAFLEQGGLREGMMRARLAERSRQRRRPS
jgi:four helix bundle suffix protein